jgi:hypothetical protein
MASNPCLYVMCVLYKGYIFCVFSDVLLDLLSRCQQWVGLSALLLIRGCLILFMCTYENAIQCELKFEFSVLKRNCNHFPFATLSLTLGLVS